MHVPAYMGLAYEKTFMSASVAKGTGCDRDEREMGKLTSAVLPSELRPRALLNFVPTWERESEVHIAE